MSNEINVCCEEKPAEDFVLSWTKTRARAGGGWAKRGGAIDFCTSDGGMRFQLDAPRLVDSEQFEFLPRDSAPNVWHVSITVIDSDHWELAFELAKEIASKFSGYVHDPQADQHSGSRGDDEARTDAVSLCFYLGRSGRDAASAQKLLEVLGRWFPSLLPKRFGSVWPFARKADKKKESAFVDGWTKEAMRGNGGFFSWRCGPAEFGGGTAGFPDLSLMRPRGSSRYVLVSFHMDRRLCRTQDQAQRLADLFCACGVELGAFFGACYVESGLRLTKSGLGYDSQTRSVDLMKNRFWVGVPAKATWLTWLGGPYPELLSGAFRGAENHKTGLLVRRSSMPVFLSGKSLGRRGAFKRYFVSYDRNGVALPAEEVPPGLW